MDELPKCHQLNTIAIENQNDLFGNPLDFNNWIRNSSSLSITIIINV